MHWRYCSLALSHQHLCFLVCFLSVASFLAFNANLSLYCDTHLCPTWMWGTSVTALVQSVTLDRVCDCRVLELPIYLKRELSHSVNESCHLDILRSTLIYIHYTDGLVQSWVNSIATHWNYRSLTLIRCSVIKLWHNQCALNSLRPSEAYMH